MKIKDSETQAYKKLLSKRLEQLRDDLGWTQQELADEIGTSQNMIFRSENDLRISTEFLCFLILWYTKNHKINTEWLFAPNNTDILRYHNDLKLGKRKRDADDAKRAELVIDLINKFQELDLLPSKSTEK